MATKLKTPLGYRRVPHEKSVALEIGTRIKRIFRQKYTTTLVFEDHTEAFPKYELDWILNLIDGKIRNQGAQFRKLSAEEIKREI